MKQILISLYHVFPLYVKVNNVPVLSQLQSVDDYFPLLFEQTLQLYALRMKDNEDQVDTVVSNHIRRVR